MLKTRIVSSQIKAFSDEKIETYAKLTKASALRGEVVSFQLLYSFFAEGEDKDYYGYDCVPTLDGELAKYATLRRVQHVPVVYPVTPKHDENYLRTTPGVYPDLLTPLNYNGKFRAVYNCLDSLWIDVKIPENTDLAGEYKFTVRVERTDGKPLAEESIMLEVIGARLPEQKLYFTQWFHCDCLASYYGVPIWSKRHWEIIENFARVAVKNGINTLLTPLLTPSLDGERSIAQLVDIKKTDGKYSFGFSRLGKWIDMCDRIGIKYLEISHFFTQGGASNAPRVEATVDGEKKMIFSYATDSRDPEYKRFLRALVKAFLRYMKRRGDDRRCFFHISDEPPKRCIEIYKEAKETVADLLDGYTFIDALFDFDYYNEGLVTTPIPNSEHLAPFLAAGVEGLWTYTCCIPTVKYSNRFISMPSWRNRSIGMQMFKYKIAGFLHWGYNFYNNRNSGNAINPYSDLEGERWVAAGDTFSVYPAPDGTPYESIRILVFYEALQDIRAMELCESLYSHEAVVKAIEEELGEELTFERCAYSDDEMLRVRERVNAMIKAAICKQ